MWDTLNNQLLLLATLIGAIASVPILVEFLIDRRKRKERLSLALDDEAVDDLHPRVAGLDELLAENADLIDRARDPAPYRPLTLGNEILILGRPQTGKRSLAQRIAKEARFDRLVTVYNPRNKDALAKAKSLLHGHKRKKAMLLLPRIDLVFQDPDEDLRAELDALIETTTNKENVLVVGTAVEFEADSELDNVFGTKLVLPGTPRSEDPARHVGEEARRMLTQVIRFYLKDATDAGFALAGMTPDEFVMRVLQRVGNPAEVEDIVALCRTRAIHRRRTGKTTGLEIDADVLSRAMDRVIVNVDAPPRRNPTHAEGRGA